MSSNDIFQSQRISYRLLKMEDIVYMEPLNQDPDVTKFFPTQKKDHAAIEAMIERYLGYYENHQLPCFLFFEIQTGEFIGSGVFFPSELGGVEVGYGIHKKFWGKGYATEALTALLHWAKHHLDAKEILAFANAENVASWRVMEKSGMQYVRDEIENDRVGKLYCIKLKK